VEVEKKKIALTKLQFLPPVVSATGGLHYLLKRQLHDYNPVSSYGQGGWVSYPDRCD
jgi:hypothetical protein